MTKRRVPREAALVIWPVAIGSVHVGAPLSLSRRDRRHGWRDGRPGPANLLGALPLAAGATLVVWALAGHYKAAPDKGWELGNINPPYLLTDGPYRFTRNPMYVGARLIWGGWAVLFGSVPVAAGAAAVTAGTQGAVAFEERQLTGLYGSEWRAFAARTPRWLGVGRP